MKEAIGAQAFDFRPAIAPGGRARYERSYLPSFGKVSTIFCLPSTTSPRKLIAVDIAVLVPGRLHQDAGLILRRDRHAVRGFGESLAVELADLLGHVLDEVDGGVALDAVVVAGIVEPLLELGGELLHRRDRRIDGQADMAAYAIGGIAGQIDHLLAEQGRLADQRLVEALLPGLAQEARALFFVDIDEDRIGIGGLELDDVGGEIGLAGLGRDIGDDLDVARGHFLDEVVATALAEVVVHPQHARRSSP